MHLLGNAHLGMLNIGSLPIHVDSCHQSFPFVFHSSLDFPCFDRPGTVSFVLSRRAVPASPATVPASPFVIVQCTL
jgi:hypothetical protein